MLSPFTAGLRSEVIWGLWPVTCLGVEWAAASGKGSASGGWASLGSVVMVIHLETVMSQLNTTVTMETSDVRAGLTSLQEVMCGALIIT